MKNSLGLLAIVPAHNEEGSIADVIREIQESELIDEILVINDASTDETSNAARKLGVRVADLPINLGIGGAVQTGFKIARELGYEFVIQIDADGQHDPLSIKDVIAPVLSGEADISIGSRHLANGNKEATFTRYAGIKFFSWVTSTIISQEITDCTSGYRALNKRALQFFADNYPVDFPDAEALVAAHRAGLRIRETPAVFRSRNRGQSSLHFWKMIYYPCKESLSIAVMVTKKPVKAI